MPHYASLPKWSPYTQALSDSTPPVCKQRMKSEPPTLVIWSASAVNNNLGQSIKNSWFLGWIN